MTTPEKLASSIYSVLAQRDIIDTDQVDICKAQVSRKVRQPGSGAMGRPHMVQEYFITIPNDGRPIIVSVRIADTRAPQHRQPIPARPGRDQGYNGYHFDASGLPLLNEEI